MKKVIKRLLIVLLIIVAVLIVGIGGLFFVKRPSDQPDDMLFSAGVYNPMSAMIFTGDAYINSIVGTDDTYNIPGMLNVTFRPTVRTKWHTHDGGQILICTYGKGYYQVEGEPVQILRAGDVVLIEPYVKHWHGAAGDGWFSHIAIETNHSSSDFLEDVTDEQYRIAEESTLEFSDRSNAGYTDEMLADISDGIIFPLGEEYDFEGHVKGEAYRSVLIPYDDVFHFPSTYNITMSPGAMTDYHTNTGGEVLVVSGGKGFYEIDGEEKKEISAGDVIKLPPDKSYRFGGTEGSWISCMLIDANTNDSQMEWK